MLALTAKIAGERLPEHVRAARCAGNRPRHDDRRDADRCERALHRRHLQRCARRFAAALCAHRCGAGARTQGGRVLVQHRLAASCPDLRLAPGRSHSTCSSCPTWTSTARTATAHATAMSQARSPGRRRTGTSRCRRPDPLAMTVDEALDIFTGTGQRRRHGSKLETLHELGIGYLTLGESTPALSGGEAQRLKLASEMGRAQDGTCCSCSTSRRLACIRLTCAR